MVRPAKPAKLANFLEEAVASNDKNRLLAALMFARYSRTELNDGARRTLAELISKPDSSVRAMAMNVIASERDTVLIKAVIDSGWRCTALDPRQEGFERFYGSLALIEGAAQCLIPVDAMVDQIVPELWSHAVETLGSEVQAAIAERVRAAVYRALDFELANQPPRVMQRARDGLEPPLFELIEVNEDGRPEAFFSRLNENDEEYQRRQREQWGSFSAFERTLTKADARIMVEDVGQGAVEVFVEAFPGEAADLARTLARTRGRGLELLTNFALRLATAISAREPNLARLLFDRLAGESGIVCITHGTSAVSLEALSVWRAAGSPALKELQDARLDAAATDHDLSQEVVAALLAGQGERLEDYVRRRLQSAVPSDNARALMVLGFGLESAFAEEELSKPSSKESLVGRARLAARYAYDRNRWSRHWYDQMAATNSGEVFWRHGALFSKVVDARLDVWVGDVEMRGSAIRSFGWSLEGALRRRIEAWKTHREKTLCGDKVPSRIFSLISG